MILKAPNIIIFVILLLVAGWEVYQVRQYWHTFKRTAGPNTSVFSSMAFYEAIVFAFAATVAAFIFLNIKL